MTRFSIRKQCGIFLACLLTLVLLSSLCLSAGASDGITELLTLDPNTMASGGDGSNDAFAWDLSGNAGLVTATLGDYTGKELYMAPGQFKITDTNGVLDDYATMALSFDIYFNAFPSERDGTTSSPDPSSSNFKSQSLVAWIGSSYDGLRIDSEGTLYSTTATTSSLDVQLEKDTWHSLKMIFSGETDRVEYWLDGERITTAPYSKVTTSSFLRILDGSNDYRAYVKNISISASNEVYECGLVKEASADFISYQTTKPDADGEFSLRVITGLDSLEYKCFGYRVLVLTKNVSGETVVKELSDTNTKAYSSIYGGQTSYSIKENFGYEYAALATITGLDANADFFELVIFPYTLSEGEENKIYGDPVSLAYAGKTDAVGYPVLHKSDTHSTLVASEDTYIHNGSSTSNGSETQFIIRNTGSVKTGSYRAAYYKFNIPAETVAELDEMTKIELKIYVNNVAAMADRQKYPMVAFGATTDWSESTAVYSDFYQSTLGGIIFHEKENARGSELDRVAANDYSPASYLSFDVLDYVKSQTPNADGSITVAFCVTQPDGYDNVVETYLASREDTAHAPYLSFEKTLYGHSISNTKSMNDGYEPLAYAEKLVNEWFDELVDKVYPKDADGNLIYHTELGEFGTDTLISLDPNTEVSGDGGNNLFTWDLGGSSGISTVSIDGYEGKAFTMAPGQYYFYDTKGVLPIYGSVAFKLDLCFDELPTMSSGSSTSPDPSSDSFKPQSILAWLGNSYDGLRIDANGNLYSASSASSALGVQLTADTWYTLEVVFSNQTGTISYWLNGECVATASFTAVTTSNYIRLFDGSNTYKACVKNISLSVPNGYGATSATGDFKEITNWKNGNAWSSSSDDNYIAATSTWSANKFSRTLSTLGTSKANAFLDSSYAETKSAYSIYGGITNAGFTGTATGYFHTEKHTDGRTYIIDPLGYPYFAVSVNQLNLGDTSNQKNYALAAYGTETAYFNAVTSELKDMGINTAFVSNDNAVLAVDNGLSTVVGLSGIGTYMGRIGRNQVREGLYPHGNTLNVFDPDFTKLVNTRNAKLILDNGYATNARVLGYTADNELSAGDNILERYLTLDPTVRENIFSYQTAWTWLARKMNTLNPTLDDLLSSPERAAINSEFLSFLYSHYYKTIKASIEAVDTNHMYFGSRAYDTCKTDEGYLRAAGYYLDVITLNLYDGMNPNETTISNIYKYSGKPFVVTEFFAKALDAIDANGYKLTNSTGAGVLTYTQEERAEYYEHYVLTLLESKSCVGWSWYRFRDNDQGLWSVGTTYTNLRPLYMYYSTVSYPVTLIDASGNVYPLGNLYSGSTNNWRSSFTQTYAGEGIASNQNVNKGIFNGNLSSVVTVYTYNADGTLNLTGGADHMGSSSYQVVDPDSENATTLTSKDGTKTFTVGTVTNGDGSYTVTKLTVYKGKYLALSDSIKKISDNIIGLVNYLDEN